MQESENSVPPTTNQVNISPKDVARFWAKVKRGADDECWLWQAGRFSNGYGQFSVCGINAGAHRVSWIITNGPIPVGLCACHACDQKLCVRPSHLWLGTSADNNADCHAKGRTAKGDRHWSRTHPERLARGDRNGSHTHPERVARGDRHGSVTHPERVARGDRNAARLYPGMFQGVKNGHAKLSEESVIEMRRLHAEGVSYRRLAAMFGVVKTAARYAVTGHNWKHLK